MEAPVGLLLLLWLGALGPTPGSASSEAQLLVNEDVKRTVDLSSHLAKVTAEVVLAHPGGGSTSRASSFVLALEPELESRLAHLGVQVSGGRSRRASGRMPEEMRDPWGGRGGAVEGVRDPLGVWLSERQVWGGTAERSGSAVPVVRVSFRTRQHKLPSVGRRPRGSSGAQGDPLVPWRPPSTPYEGLGCDRVWYLSTLLFCPLDMLV